MSREETWHVPARGGHRVRRALSAPQVATWRSPQRLPVREWDWSARPRQRPVPDDGHENPTEATVSPELARIYELCACGDTDGALDQILDVIDELIARDDLADCDALLRQIDLEQLDTASALGFLSATYMVRDRLQARGAFYDAVYARVARDRPDDAHKLVARFR